METRVFVDGIAGGILTHTVEYTEMDGPTHQVYEVCVPAHVYRSLRALAPEDYVILQVRTLSLVVRPFAFQEHTTTGTYKVSFIYTRSV